MFTCVPVHNLLDLKLFKGVDEVYIHGIPSPQMSWYASYTAIKKYLAK